MFHLVNFLPMCWTLEFKKQPVCLVNWFRHSNASTDSLIPHLPTYSFVLWVSTQIQDTVLYSVVLTSGSVAIVRECFTIGDPRRLQQNSNNINMGGSTAKQQQYKYGRIYSKIATILIWEDLQQNCNNKNMRGSTAKQQQYKYGRIYSKTATI